MKTKYGHMACPDCAARVVVKINERETLSYRCDECDGNGYSKKGEGRYATWVNNTTRVAADPAPAPAAAPTPAPAPRKKDEAKPAQPGAMPWMRPAKT